MSYITVIHPIKMRLSARFSCFGCMRSDAAFTAKWLKAAPLYSIRRGLRKSTDGKTVELKASERQFSLK